MPTTPATSPALRRPSPGARRGWLRWLALGLAPLAAAQVAPSLAPVVTTASRAPQAPARIPFSVVTLPADALRAAPAVTLDGALRGVPGFSLFRRNDSLTAHPTVQGLSLRGLGPSGASRSLVLLDGVPLNDPFGGWIAWSKAPTLSLSAAEIVRGGGATAWGNAALGGVVQLLTRAAAAPAGEAALTVGDFATRSLELSAARTAGPGTLQLAGRAFATDGFPLVAPAQRGPVDIAAWSRHHWLAGTWTQPVGSDAEVTANLRTFGERRGNGTPGQRNSSRENLGSVSLRAQPRREFSWRAVAYGQDQQFSSTFSSVNAARTAETPASDQYAVPATAAGLSWTGTWEPDPSRRTSAGLDLRSVRGETRELASYVGGAFTRERIVGGDQAFGGLFFLHERELGRSVNLFAGGRLDRWRDAGGHRDEFDRATGATVRIERPADRSGAEFSPGAGVSWQPAEGWRVRAAAQSAFRRPTLNELYRPFRVGNIITEANPALATEHTRSAELALERTSGRATWSVAGFWNALDDAVANVTVARGPGTFPVVGFVPAGGLGRQRLNLDRALVRGAELSWRWAPANGLSLTADYLYADATVRSARVAPDLVGRRLAQVPRHAAVAGLDWQGPGGLRLVPRVRWMGRQFEDDENQLVLGAVIVLDVALELPAGRAGRLFLHAENLGGARVETGRSALGVVNTGTPRFLTGGLRRAW